MKTLVGQGVTASVTLFDGVILRLHVLCKITWKLTCQNECCNEKTQHLLLRFEMTTCLTNNEPCIYSGERGEVRLQWCTDNTEGRAALSNNTRW